MEKESEVGRSMEIYHSFSLIISSKFKSSGEGT